jgi:hypothetical protein
MWKPKKRYPVFATSDNLIVEKFRSLLQGGANDKIFNEKFFDVVERRHGELGKQQQALFFFQIPIFIYLILVLAGIDINLSILGISAGKNLREVLVLISAGLGVWGAWANNQKGAIEGMLKARNERLAKGDKEKLDFLNVGYGLNPRIR